MAAAPVTNHFMQAVSDTVSGLNEFFSHVLEKRIPVIKKMLNLWLSYLDHGEYAKDSLQDMKDMTAYFGVLRVGDFVNMVDYERKELSRKPDAARNIDLVIDLVQELDDMTAQAIDDVHYFIAPEDESVLNRLHQRIAVLRTDLRTLKNTAQALDDSTQNLLDWQDNTLSNDCDGAYGPYATVMTGNNQLMMLALDRESKILTMDIDYLKMMTATKPVLFGLEALTFDYIVLMVKSGLALQAALGNKPALTSPEP